MRFPKLLCFCILFFKIVSSQAQISPAVPGDIRTIEIIRGNTLRERTVDSVTKVETIAGNVIIHEGTTKFTCDSAIINRRSNSMEAFGNVTINQGDSVFTSSQYLKYVGNERVAYLKKNVKLTDRKSVLTTQDLEYNLNTGIGKYVNGGKVVNRNTVLTSRQGIYYEDTKDIYFINKVDVVDPRTKIKADSLLYNTLTEKITFIGPTYIKNKDGDIFTTQGNYDLRNGEAYFGNSSVVKDTSGRVYQAINIAFAEKLGQVQLEGNAIIKDSTNKFIVTGNQIFINQKNNSFLATKKPVLIFWQDKDTTYVSADTLFSGFTKKVSGEDDLVVGTDSINIDSVPVVIKNDTARAAAGLRKKLMQETALADSINVPVDSMLVVDSGIVLPRINSIKPLNQSNKKIIDQNKKDTLIRYFLGYRHVRIFNDSLQAVCDSMFFSGADSVFRLFYEPVIWSGQSQVNGDTIFLYTKNKKADRVQVFDNGMMINKINSQFYNQVAGRTINGYFKEGVIDYMKVKGSPAESIYYIQDKDSAYTGMNRADGSVIDLYFVKQQLNTVKFLNDVHGKLYPIRQIPQDQKLLKNFNWLDKRRPKNKLELFE
ncbi:MAG: OstA-like protein [Chitinophagaceae bacterium]